ncbi:MAG: hypothetical protein N3A38_14235 [Planctomycetota bacterium]|nr:hypothetical protein [Planctomycetota bacterium]
MLRRFVLAVEALVFPVACVVAAGEPGLEELVRLLEDEKYYVRDKAVPLILKYFEEHPDDVWEIGTRLSIKRDAMKDAVAKLEDVVEKIAAVRMPRGTPELDWCVAPGYMDSKSYIESSRGIKRPIMVILITSEPMLRFYRPIGQRGGYQGIPDFDFKHRMLLGAIVTGFGTNPNFDRETLIAECTAKREFKVNRTTIVLNLKVGSRPEASCLKRFVILRKDNVSIFVRDDYGPWECVAEISENMPPVGWEDGKLKGERPKERETWKPGEGMVKVPIEDDADWILSSRNILYLRKVAETCDAKFPAGQRRKLLERACMLDPLLPYVMLTHLAERYPEAFKEDCEYWEERFREKWLEGSAIVRPLFEGAIEEGRKIIARQIAPDKAPEK